MATPSSALVGSQGGIYLSATQQGSTALLGASVDQAGVGGSVYSLFGNTGAFVLTGEALVLKRALRFPGTSGTFSTTGAGAIAGRRLTPEVGLSTGAFSFFGHDADFLIQHIHYSWQWYQLTSQDQPIEEWVLIPGAINKLYSPQSTDEGFFLGVIEAASDENGITTIPAVTASPVIPPPLSVFRVGFNIEGAQFGGPPYPGLLGTNYFMPTVSDGALGQAKGIYAVRLPLLWERAQPTLGGALNMTYIGQIQSAVSMLYSYGMQVMLDLHNFGSRIEGKIGGGTVTIDHFSGFWALMAAQFVGNPGILSYDIMNEWAGMPNSGVCPEANQAAITAIGAVDNTMPIFVEGDNFSSAWSWLIYNSGLYTLTSLGNPLIFSAHIYFDHDNSGTNFNWDTEIGVAGVSPPGLNVNVNIGVQRATPFVEWCQAHGVSGNIGECGITQGYGDNVNWAVCGTNLLNYLQSNKISIFIWAAGSGGSYPMSLDSWLGQQSMDWPYLQPFTGSTDEPNVYFLSLGGPLNNPGPSMDAYCTVGVASPSFYVEYRGNTPGFTVTLSDGGQGGTFTPSSLMLSGVNPIGTFTYTPEATATISISTTNSGGFIDPPPIWVSTLTDIFVGLGVVPTNVYALYRKVAPYGGPVVTLQRPSDGQQQSFSFNSAGNLPRQAIEEWAGERSIPIITHYDQSSYGNNISYTAGSATLNLVNSAGYPEINVPLGAEASFNSPTSGQTIYPPIGGLNMQTVITRVNQSSSSNMGLFRQDFYTGPIIFGISTYTINNTGYVGGNLVGTSGVPNGAVNLDIITGAYHNYAVTYTASNNPNNLISYTDGAPYATATIPYYLLNTAYGSETVNLYYFRFYTPSGWVGQFQSLIMLEGQALTQAQIELFVNSDNTYYSTPLPDTLPPLPPLILGTQAGQAVYLPNYTTPFGGVTISDSNSGAPVDSVTITLSGSPGTLSGSGISGTGPYTIAAASAASVTATLQALQFTTSGSIGATTGIAIQVTSSAVGTSPVTDTTTTVVVTAYVAETPYPAPSGTFSPINYFGVNLAGGEQNPTSVRPLGYDYVYPRNYEIDYYASVGMGLIRMPITSQRVYPSAFGLLDPTQMGYIESVIAYAFTKNMYVVLDPHDYGSVWDSRGSTNRLIGSDPAGSPLFSDLWSRLATRFKNYPNVIFGLMNEPWEQSAVQWTTGAAPAITAIRATGATQLITIPGIGFSSPNLSVDGSGAAWLALLTSGLDPLNNYVFEVHNYLDSNDSGTSPTCAAIGTARFTGVTAWAAANNVKLFLGECGWSPTTWSGNATGCAAQSAAVMAYLNANQAQWLGMSYWLGGSWLYYTGYMYFCGPTNANPQPETPEPTYVQSEQMTLLLEYMW